jgi:hypothetical protein
VCIISLTLCWVAITDDSSKTIEASTADESNQETKESRSCEKCWKVINLAHYMQERARERHTGALESHTADPSKVSQSAVESLEREAIDLAAKSDTASARFWRIHHANNSSACR